MKKLIGILALAAFAVPAVMVASGAAQGETVQSKSAKKAKTNKEIVVPRETGLLPSSAFAHHPSYDVYVNGEYAGSDPDPRVRWTIKREYCQQRPDGC